jgi:FtsH-binding integral membrane protein
MAQGPDRRTMSRDMAAQAQVDTGLRSYMLRVYNYMSLGVAFTGALAMIIAMNPALVMTLAPLNLVFFLGILGLGFFAPRLMMTKSIGVAQLCFWIYAGMWGMILAPAFFVYAQSDPMIIVRAFLITAGTFAGMSLFGYTTKRDLSPFATFFMMAAIGLIIAMLVNFFFVESTGFSLLISCGVVLIFSGVTAWETQMIKNFYYESDGHDVTTRKAIFGAFMLYGSFITLFIHILNILGIMRSE